MVKVINKSVCRGVAGRRSGKVKGVVIHNTADNGTAVNHMNRLGGYSNLQLQNGFAHYFIDEDTIVRTEDTYNMAWHTANSDGNANYIGYEVCRSTGNEKQFLQAEQNTFKQVAEDLKYYGLPANRDTVRLHKEFVATACPHRSWELHGRSINSVKDYFIKEIKKYMNGGNNVNNPKVRRHKVRVHAKNYSDPKYQLAAKYNTSKKHNHGGYVLGNEAVIDTYWFLQKSPEKNNLIKYYEDNNIDYSIIIE